MLGSDGSAKPKVIGKDWVPEKEGASRFENVTDGAGVDRTTSVRMYPTFGDIYVLVAHGIVRRVSDEKREPGGRPSQPPVEVFGR